MAQEKPLDNREKEAVGLNTPVEGLSVSGPGKFYPDEYSAQIAAYGKQTELMSRIPESLAKIIEYADDYKITAYHNKEQSETYKKGLENELYKNTLEIDSANRVNAKKLLLQEKLVEAKRRADESNGDITLTEAYNEVFSSDEFRNPEEFTSLNSQKNWQSQYDSMQQVYTEKAMENDILNVQAEMGMNIEHAIALVGNRCLTEGLDPSDAMNEFTKTIFLYRKHVTAKDLRDYTHKAWDAFVKGCANNAIAAVENGDMTIEQAETTLRRLLDTTAYQKFVYLNKDGEAEKDADGQDATFTVALSSDVQASLLADIKSLQNKKGRGKEDIDLAGYWKNLNNDLGLPENFDIDKPGELKDIFKGMLGKSDTDVFNEIDKFIRFTLNSGATPSQIGTYARKGVKLLALVDSFAYAREMITANNADPNAAKNYIVRMGQQIDNGLRSGQDPAKWNPLKVNGTTFNSRLDFYSKGYGLPERVDGELISRGYFEIVSNTFKMFSKMDTDSLLTYLDSDVYIAANTIGATENGTVREEYAVTAQEVLKNEGTGIPRINDKSVEKEAADLKQLAAIVKARNGWGIPEEAITKRIDELQINTPLKAAWFAKANIAAGTTGSLEKFAYRHIAAGKDDKYFGISQDMLAGLLITADVDVEKRMSEYYAENQSKEARYEAYKQFTQGKNKIFAEEVSLIMGRNKVPGVFRPAVQKLAQDMVVAYGQKGEDKGKISSRISDLIKTNFIELKHMYNGQLVYKNSDVLKSWSDEKELNSSLDTIYDFVKNKTGTKVDFLPDLDTGKFQVTMNGETLAYPVHIRTPQELGIKPGSVRSTQFITQLAGAEAMMELALNNNKLIDKLSRDAKQSYVLVKNEEIEQCLTRMLSAARNPENLQRLAKRYVNQGYDEYYKKWRVQPQIKPYLDVNTDFSGLIKGDKTWFGSNSFVQIKGGLKKTNPHDVITLPRLSKFGYGDGAVQNVQNKKETDIINALFLPNFGAPQEGAIMRMWFEESNNGGTK